MFSLVWASFVTAGFVAATTSCQHDENVLMQGLSSIAHKQMAEEKAEIVRTQLGEVLAANVKMQNTMLQMQNTISQLQDRVAELEHERKTANGEDMWTYEEIVGKKTLKLKKGVNLEVENGNILVHTDSNYNPCDNDFLGSGNLILGHSHVYKKIDEQFYCRRRQ